MTGLARLANTASADDVTAILERDGGVVIEDFVGPSTLAGLLGDLLPLLERQATGLNRFAGHSTRRLSALFAHTRHCAEIVTHPLYLPVARHFICRPRLAWVGERRAEMVADVRIGVTQAIQIWPGQEPQPLHRDDSALMWRHLGDGAEARVQIMVALSDFTAENGGTLVIPGSHRWDEERKPEVSETIPTEMAAGSALIWLGSVYHGGGANRSDAPRAGLSIGLDASNLRQEENLYLALAPELVASYPEEIQQLLGWSAGRNFMGWVEIDGQMADPIELLRRVDAA
jgi:ectoine hydroxylase-related dioxygenase (phytanoyl-CoA dioxygenase family)